MSVQGAFESNESVGPGVGLKVWNLSCFLAWLRFVLEVPDVVGRKSPPPLQKRQAALPKRSGRRRVGAGRATDPAGQARRRQANVVMREMMNSVMHVLSTGCQWCAFPKDLPPRSTQYDYFDLCNWSGTLERTHHVLCAECRERE